MGSKRQGAQHIILKCWCRFKTTSGYLRLCCLVPAGSTGGLYPAFYPAHPLLHRLSLETRPVGSTDGRYPGRLLLRRLLPGSHALLTPVVHRSPAASPASPSPTPHAGPGQAGLRGNTKPSAAHFGTLFLSATSIGQNPKSSSQIDGQCGSFQDLVSVSFFRWVVIWGLQNRPRKDCFWDCFWDYFCQFLSLGCHLGGCRIGLAETVNGSERTDRQTSELIY